MQTADGKGTQVLVCARRHPSLTLDPGRDSNGESWKVLAHIYDGLVNFRPGTFDLIPGLASGWEVEDGGMAYVFHLRHDVHFQDGTLFDAESVLFSHLRQHDPDHDFYAVGGGPKCWQSAGMHTVVDRIERIDDFKVRYRLQAPTATFLCNLAMPCFGIVSPTAARREGDGFGRRPVGTGPFGLREWCANGDLVLRANRNYWDQGPFLDGLVYRLIPSTGEQVRALAEGGVQVIESPDLSMLGQIEDAGGSLLRRTGLNVAFIAMNCQRRPFDDRKVRLAMNYAVNRAEIVDRVFGGLAKVADSPIPPDLKYYYQSPEGLPQDAERARCLLAEAGYAQGFETDLWVLPAPRPYLPDGPTVACILSDQLSRVGVRVRTVLVSPDEYWRRVDAGDHMLCMDGWSGDNGDPDNFLATTLGGGSPINLAFWRNQKFTELLVKGRHTLEPEDRRGLYWQAQEVFREELPWIPLVHAEVIVGVSKNIQGLAVCPTGSVSFRCARFVAATEARCALKSI